MPTVLDAGLQRGLPARRALRPAAAGAARLAGPRAPCYCLFRTRATGSRTRNPSGALVDSSYEYRRLRLPPPCRSRVSGARPGEAAPLRDPARRPPIVVPARTRGGGGHGTGPGPLARRGRHRVWSGAGTGRRGARTRSCRRAACCCRTCPSCRPGGWVRTDRGAPRRCWFRPLTPCLAVRLPGRRPARAATTGVGGTLLRAGLDAFDEACAPSRPGWVEAAVGRAVDVAAGVELPPGTACSPTAARCGRSWPSWARGVARTWPRWPPGPGPPRAAAARRAVAARGAGWPGCPRVRYGTRAFRRPAPRAGGAAGADREPWTCRVVLHCCARPAAGSAAGRRVGGRAGSRTPPCHTSVAGATAAPPCGTRGGGVVRRHPAAARAGPHPRPGLHAPPRSRPPRTAGAGPFTYRQPARDRVRHGRPLGFDRGPSAGSPAHARPAGHGRLPIRSGPARR